MLLSTITPLLGAGTVTWDNGGGDDAWSTGANWTGSPANTEPGIADEAVLPAAYSGTKTLSAGEAANSLTVGNNVYTLSGGDLTLGNAGQTDAGKIDVYSGRTFTINSTLAGNCGLTKTSAGTLTLGGTNLLTGGITLQAGTLNVAGAYRIALGNNAVTLNGGELVLGWNVTPVYLREFGGSVNAFNSAWTDILELRLNALNDATYSGGALGSSGQGVGINKTGPGTLTVAGGAVYDRSTAVTAVWRGGLTFSGTAGALLAGWNANGVEISGGIFTLDETSADIDRYADTMAVNAMSSGTFRYLGAASANSTETLGAPSYPNNALWADRGGTIDVQVQPGASGTAALTFASLTQPQLNDWNNQAAFNFVALAGTLGTEAKVVFTTDPSRIQNGVLNSAYANGTNFAAYDTDTDGAGPDTEDGVKVFSSYNNTADVNTPAATDTVLINAGTATLTLSGAKQYNALKIDGARILNLAGHNLTLGTSAAANSLAAMILKTGAGTAEITGSGGEIQVAYDAANFPTHYNIRVHEGALKISAPLDGNSNGRLQLFKTGSGLLWLTPGGTWQVTDGGYASGLSAAEGVVRLNPSDTDFGNLLFVLAGGIIELTDGLTWNPTIGVAAANLRWQGNGGFSAYGANATFSPAITWGASHHIPDGAALLLNSSTADSKVTLSGILNLGTDAAKMYLREVYVADNTGASTDLAEISGQIISDTTAGGGGTPTYTYHLVKTGAGTLILSHANNTYSGATYVKEGTLLVNGTLAAPASSTVTLNPDYSAVTVMNGGTLGGTGTIARKVYVGSGGSVAATGAGMTLGTNLTLEAGATLAVQVSGGQCNQLTVNGTVDLTGSTLVLTEPVRGTIGQYTIVSNDGSDPVTGTFAGLPEGATVTGGLRTYRISYRGGDGNDVVLTLVPSAGTVIFFR